MPRISALPLAAAITPSTKFPTDTAGGETERVTAEMVHDSALRAGLAALGIYHVDHYGAVGDGVTNDRTAFQDALDAAVAAGGGIIFARPGAEYVLTGYALHSVEVPITAAGYQPAVVDMSANLYALNPTGIHFEMPGTTLRSTDSTNSVSAVILLDGARNCTLNIGTIESITELDAGEPSAYTEVGRNAIVLIATQRDGYNVRIPSLVATTVHAAVYIIGAADATYRVRSTSIGTLYAGDSLYGVALFDNGDDTTFDQITTKVVGRPLYVFGVSGVYGNVSNLEGFSGLQLLIKAYDRDTTDVSIAYRVMTANTGSPRVGLASEHNLGTQPDPAVLRNIEIRYDDTGSAHPAPAIYFQYLIDAVEEPTVAETLFDGIRLVGILFDSTVTSGVLQAPAGRLDLRGLVAQGGSSSIPLTDIYESGGFFHLTDIPNDQSVRYRNAADDGYAGRMGATTADNLQIVSLITGKLIQFLTTAGKVQFGTVAAGVRGAVGVNGYEHLSLTTAQRDALTGVTEGTEIFNTDTNKMNFYTGAAWEAVTSA